MSPTRIATTASSTAEARPEDELLTREQHAEVMQVRAVVRTALEARRHLLDDGQPEALEQREERRERHLAAELRDDEPGQRIRALVRLVGLFVLQPDRELLARAYALEQAHVQRGEIGMGRGLVVVGETLGVVGGELAALDVAVLDREPLSEIVVPGTAGRAHLRLELARGRRGAARRVRSGP